MKLIVHSGADRIGASCLEIASEKTRLIFDCGWPLAAEGDPVPPPVPGLFAEGSPPEALLLSHAHADHTGFLDQIRPRVPVYATALTSKTMQVGSLYARGVSIPRRVFREVPVPASWRESVTPILLGDLRVTAYPVDHSSPGAVGYLVEHGSERLFYTGDLRFHGWKNGMRRRIVGDLAGTLDLLITEGTNVGRPSRALKSEHAVMERACALMRGHPSLVMAAYSPQNIDRFVSFFKAALRSYRTFVCDVYQAAVLQQLNLPSLPKPSRDGLRVFLPPHRRKIPAYEDRLGDAIISLEEILATPQRFLMLTRPSMMLDIANQLPIGTRLLYGMWSGYRQTGAWRRVEQMLAACGGEVHECHASGHALEEDLFAFIQELAPRAVWPVHTTAAETFRLRLTNSRLA
ncbi:MAG TPA: MBL fold metallo-hydrolase [Chthoniobacteraceae bacterium]|jgi:ribonuclease J|nr:MBL fold metallo-hydrolase [Chthoniobacteraceae bacterium]